MKNCLIFNTEQELINYFGGYDKIPSKVLALVKDVPYTSSGSAKIENALFSSTNNANTPIQGTAVQPSGTSAIQTATSQAIVVEEQHDELSDIDTLADLILFGEEENTNISEE